MRSIKVITMVKSSGMKKLVMILVSVFMLGHLSAQDGATKLYPKHEIGFSVGAFPIIGLMDPPNTGLGLPIIDDNIGHVYNIKDGDNYEKMYHIGAYSLNYNYHFNSKHSMGVSFSWVGKHIDKYWIYSPSMFNRADTINGSGWKHYFTLQGNYRNTYYRQKKISLYFGIHSGITLCVRDRDILHKERWDYFLGSESNARYYFAPAMHLNAFGIETGEKYVFNLELGFGTQGIVKAGFRYKF